jgi:hypothetical protein
LERDIFITLGFRLKMEHLCRLPHAARVVACLRCRFRSSRGRAVQNLLGTNATVPLFGQQAPILQDSAADLKKDRCRHVLYFGDVPTFSGGILPALITASIGVGA